MQISPIFPYFQKFTKNRVEVRFFRATAFLEFGILWYFKKKKLLKKILISRRYDFLKFVTFFDFCLISKKLQKSKKITNFKKSYLREIKIFFNNFFFLKYHNIPNSKNAVARKNLTSTRFLVNFWKYGKIGEICKK